VYDLRLRWAAAWGLFHGSSSAIFNSTKAIALLVGGSMLAAGATTAAQLTTFVLCVPSSPLPAHLRCVVGLDVSL
jgi:ABC-type multidrug transport system fused ATPase/permease subunit